VPWWAWVAWGVLVILLGLVGLGAEVLARLLDRVTQLQVQQDRLAQHVEVIYKALTK
jgi:hypothetical protein